MTKRAAHDAVVVTAPLLMSTLPQDVMELILGAVVRDTETMIALLCTAHAFFAVLRPVVVRFYARLARKMRICTTMPEVVALRYLIIASCVRVRRTTQNRITNAFCALPCDRASMLRLYCCLWLAEREHRYFGWQEFMLPRPRDSADGMYNHFTHSRVREIYMVATASDGTTSCAPLVPMDGDALIECATRPERAVRVVVNMPVNLNAVLRMAHSAIRALENPYDRIMYRAYLNDATRNINGVDYIFTAFDACITVAHKQLECVVPLPGNDYSTAQLAFETNGVMRHFWADENIPLREHCFRFTGRPEEASLAHRMHQRRHYTHLRFRAIVMQAMGGAACSKVKYSYRQHQCPDCGYLACYAQRTDAPPSVTACDNALEGETRCSHAGCCHGCECTMGGNCPPQCSCDCHIFEAES